MSARYRTKGYLKIGPCRPNRFWCSNASSPFFQQGRAVSPCRWIRLPENPNAHFQVAFATTKERKNRQTEPFIRLARKSPKGTAFGACKAFCFSGRENKCWEMQICACTQAQRILIFVAPSPPLCKEKRIRLSFGYRPYLPAKGGIIFCCNSAAWPEAGLPWLDGAQRSIFQVACTQA